jgi:hypothetical protein
MDKAKLERVLIDASFVLHDADNSTYFCNIVDVERLLKAYVKELASEQSPYGYLSLSKDNFVVQYIFKTKEHDTDITLYTIPPDQLAKIADLEAEIASLKEQMEMNATERLI